MQQDPTRSDRTAPDVPTPRLPWVWGDLAGTTPPPAPPDRPVHLVRAVRVAAPASVVFDWFGQLRVAPYSYDLVDNLGRRSPPSMTRADPIEVGQPFMQIFTLTSFEPSRRITLELTDPAARRLFGPLTVTYRALPLPEREGQPACILRCDLFLRRPSRGMGRVRQLLLAWGDLVMMRRQLLNLARLSERTASST